MKLKMILITILLLSGLRFSNAQNGPLVSFTYDDGFASWYDTAFPLFQQYGFPVVLYINGANTWVSGAVNELHEMQDAGWEISNHTWDHNQFWTNDSIVDFEVSSMKTWLDANGFPNSGFASPYNDWSHNPVKVVRKNSIYYCASGGFGFSQPYDPYFLRRVGISNDVPIETIKGYLDAAVADNLWIIFSGHEIGGTYGDPNGGFSQSTELIQMVCDEVVARGIPVKTVREVINDLFPPGSVIECSEDSLQDPVLTSFEADSLGFATFNTSIWNEYWHDLRFWVDPRYSGTPVVYCHTSNDTLPVMKFHRYIPNGEYDVRATIIEYDAGRTYRLFYSFDENNPSQFSVDVSKNSDVSLGTVTITNGQFALYTQKADVLSGLEGYVGWAFIRLISPPLTLNLKVFLEGPYNGGGSMTTTLNTSNLIPLSSNNPYPAAVYGHYTVSNLTSIPNSNIVDWVLIELRTTASGPIVARRAAFLKNDGTIVDIDGVSPVTFNGISAGNYFVVVRHRNHLAIMTSSSIPLSSNSAEYDFSTEQTKAYGINPMKDLGGGVFGMVAGDGNQDGLVTSTDFNVFNPKFTSAASGYEYSDWNLDGLVTSTDFNFFNPNFTTAKQTFVP